MIRNTSYYVLVFFKNIYFIPISIRSIYPSDIYIYLSIYRKTFVIPKSTHLPSRLLCLKSVLQQQMVVSNELMLFSAQGAQAVVRRDTEPQTPDCHRGSQFRVRSAPAIDHGHRATHHLPERRVFICATGSYRAAQRYKTRPVVEREGINLTDRGKSLINNLTLHPNVHTIHHICPK